MRTADVDLKGKYLTIKVDGSGLDPDRHRDGREAAEVRRPLRMEKDKD